MAKDAEHSRRTLVLSASAELRELAERVLVGVADPEHCEDIAASAERLEDDSFELVIASPDVAAGLSAPDLMGAMARDTSSAQWIWVDPELDAARVAEIRGAGAIDCLLSPVAEATLQSVVSRALQLRRLGDENARLAHTLQIMEACRELANCLDPGKLYPVALDLLLRATKRRRGVALFRRESMPQTDSVALRGFAENEKPEICRVLLDEKRVEIEMFTETAVLDRGVLHDALRQAGIDDVRSLLVLPICGEATELGVACLFDEGRDFGPDDVDCAGTIVDHSRTALRNAETYALAKERAFIDDVTEVYNSRYLLTTVENEIQRAERYGNPLSVLFLDLDRFKLVNDEYGHLVGSETLRRLSKVLEQCIRQVDTLARYGGDEFTIVLVDTAHAAALAIAERIRSTVESHVFEVARDAHLRLTISIGVGTCPDHGTNRDALLDASDKAMYRAKSDGRNRVCSASHLG